ncbi:MAG: tyrosine-type recombinase/integrase, partial [Terriglobia bacterium]
MASIYETQGGYGIDYRDEFGRRKRKIVGSETAARAIALKIEEEVSQARKALHQQHNTQQNISVAEATTAHINFQCSTPATRHHLGAQARMLNKFMGAVSVQEVTPQLIDAYLKHRRQSLSQTAYAQEVYFIKRVFAWLTSQWFISIDPSTGLKAPRAIAATVNTLTYDEEAKLQAATRPRTWLKILLALDAGLRHGETLQVKKNHISQEEKTLTVWSNKSRNWRIIPLTERLQQTLAGFLRVCTNPDAHVLNIGGREVKNRNTLKQARRDAGFYFRFHDLRHTFATRIAAVTRNPQVVRVLLGHAPKSNTDLYVHPTLEE